MGIGSLSIDLSPRKKGSITNLNASGKFHEKLLTKQKMMEALLIENRVKKLKLEDERLSKQIEKANKQSHFADSVR